MISICIYCWWMEDVSFQFPLVDPCIHTHRELKRQGRNEVRWRPGQEAGLASQCSNLPFASKCTVLKKVLVTLLGLSGAPRSHSAPSAVIRRPGTVPSCPPLLCPWQKASFSSLNPAGARYHKPVSGSSPTFIFEARF